MTHSLTPSLTDCQTRSLTLSKRGERENKYKNIPESQTLLTPKKTKYSISSQTAKRVVSEYHLPDLKNPDHNSHVRIDLTDWAIMRARYAECRPIMGCQCKQRRHAEPARCPLSSVRRPVTFDATAAPSIGQHGNDRPTS